MSATAAISTAQAAPIKFEPREAPKREIKTEAPEPKAEAPARKLDIKV